MSAIEYTCPNCGGKLEFDSQTQKLKCPYCDSTFKIDYFDHRIDDSSKVDAKDEENHLSIYICNTCAGEIITEETSAATSCPFCGNPVVMPSKLKGEFKPDLVIPFKYSRNQAKEALVQHALHKTLLPDVFVKNNHIDELKGVYVPFWLYDASADAHMQMLGKRVRSYISGDMQVEETKIYDVQRDGQVVFKHVPVDASSAMDNKLMESLEPFDFSQTVPYKSAYLTGYYANRYDQKMDEGIKRAHERMEKTTQNILMQSATNYSSLDIKSFDVEFRDAKPLYVLYPIYLLTTTYNNEKFTFAMNGQSGKFVGDLPMDEGKYWRLFFTYALIITGIIFFVVFLIF